MNFLTMQQELAGRLRAYDETISGDATQLKRWLNIGQQHVTSADNPTDGLALSISEKGVVSIPYIAGLTHQSEQDVIEALTKGPKPQIYFDPAQKGYDLAADYMAGNVKRKYREALDAGLHDQAEALKKVWPEDVRAGDLKARLGSPWIDRDAYEGFVTHLLGEDASAQIRHVPATGGFAVHIEGGDPVMLKTRWGTTVRNADDLITRILNSKSMTVLNPEDAEGKRTVNVEATQAAIDKADEKLAGLEGEEEESVLVDPDAVGHQALLHQDADSGLPWHAAQRERRTGGRLRRGLRRLPGTTEERGASEGGRAHLCEPVADQHGSAAAGRPAQKHPQSRHRAVASVVGTPADAVNVGAGIVRPARPVGHLLVF